MKRLLVLACIVFAFAFAVIGDVRESDGGDPRGVLPAIAQAPAKARAWKNLYEGQPGTALGGEKLYPHHCAECHGADARGGMHATNLRSPRVQNATPDEVAKFLRNGNLAKGRPSWSGLPAERRWQIVTYRKTLR